MVANARDADIRNKLVLLKTRDLDAWDVETLVEWSRDPHDELRDWATFSLGAGSRNSETVRQALLDRVEDADFDTMSEALCGLARRRDPRGIEPLVKALQGEVVGTLMVEAAGYYACPELARPLEELLPWWDVDDELLQKVIARCRGEETASDRYWDYVSDDC